MDEPEELLTEKNVIRNLLISSPSSMTLHHLLRVYQENVGKELPFRPFGHRTPLDFLASIPDTVRIKKHSGRQALLMPVENAISGHMNQLVKQEKSSSRNSDEVVGGEALRRRRVLLPTPVSPRRQPLPPRLIRSSYPMHSYPLKKSWTTTETTNKSLEHYSQEISGHNMFKGPLPETTPGRDHCFEVGGGVSSQLRSDEGSSSSEADDKTFINENLKKNIREVLNDYPNGLLLSKFPQKYMAKFAVHFSSQDYGFVSLKEFVLALPDIFAHEKFKSNDWLLFDVRAKREPITRCGAGVQKWIPINVLDNMVKLVSKYPNGIYGDKILEVYKRKYKEFINVKEFGFESISSFLVFCQSVDCRQVGDHLVVFPLKKTIEEDSVDKPPALPSVLELAHMWSKFWPENVCTMEERFMPFQVPPAPLEYLKVRVVDVNNPHSIWLQLLDKFEDVNNLMDDLNIFYDSEESSYVISNHVVTVGLMCSVKFNGDKRWHRVKVIRVENDFIEVMYVDFGTKGFVSIKDLRFLHKKFGQLPIQAIRGKMAELTWPENLSNWPLETNQFLYDLTFNKALVGEIVKVHFEEPYLDVVLFDTAGPKDICINNMLLENEVAIHCKAMTISSNSSSSDEVEQEEQESRRLEGEEEELEEEFEEEEESVEESVEEEELDEQEDGGVEQCVREDNLVIGGEEKIEHMVENEERIKQLKEHEIMGKEASVSHGGVKTEEQMHGDTSSITDECPVFNEISENYYLTEARLKRENELNRVFSPQESGYFGESRPGSVGVCTVTNGVPRNGSSPSSLILLTPTDSSNPSASAMVDESCQTNALPPMTEQSNPWKKQSPNMQIVNSQVPCKHGAAFSHPQPTYSEAPNFTQGRCYEQRRVMPPPGIGVDTPGVRNYYPHVSYLYGSYQPPQPTPYLPGMEDLLLETVRLSSQIQDIAQQLATIKNILVHHGLLADGGVGLEGVAHSSSINLTPPVTYQPPVRHHHNPESSPYRYQMARHNQQQSMMVSTPSGFQVPSSRHNEPQTLSGFQGTVGPQVGQPPQVSLQHLAALQQQLTELHQQVVVSSAPYYQSIEDYQGHNRAPTAESWSRILPDPVFCASNYNWMNPENNSASSAFCGYQPYNETTLTSQNTSTVIKEGEPEVVVDEIVSVNHRNEKSGGELAFDVEMNQEVTKMMAALLQPSEGNSYKRNFDEAEDSKLVLSQENFPLHKPLPEVALTDTVTEKTLTRAIKSPSEKIMYSARTEKTLTSTLLEASSVSSFQEETSTSALPENTGVKSSFVGNSKEGHSKKETAVLADEALGTCSKKSANMATVDGSSFQWKQTVIEGSDKMNNLHHSAEERYLKILSASIQTGSVQQNEDGNGEAITAAEKCSSFPVSGRDGLTPCTSSDRSCPDLDRIPCQGNSGRRTRKLALPTSRYHSHPADYLPKNERIIKIVIYNKYLHVLRLDQLLMVPAEEVMRTFTMYTTMTIISHRFKNMNTEPPLVKIRLAEYPKLKAEFKRSLIFGVKPLSQFLTLIPIRRITEFLFIGIKNCSSELINAFKALQKWERSNLQNFIDVNKERSRY